MLAPGLFRWEVLRHVAQLVHDAGEDGEPPSTHVVLARARRDEAHAQHAEAVCGAAVQLMSRVYEATEGKPERLRAHFTDCLRRARSERALTIETKPRPPASNADTSTAGSSAATSSSDVASQLAQRLAKLRQAGPDLRRMPKPSG
jgi:hypothetical protein